MSAAVAATEEQAEETVTHGAHSVRVAASWRVGIGGKTWSTGALACKHLAAHAARYAALAPKRQLRILELGAGTGLASATAARLGADVVATDVSDISLELLRRAAADGAFDVQRLDFTDLDAVAALGGPTPANLALARACLIPMTLLAAPLAPTLALALTSAPAKHQH